MKGYEEEGGEDGEKQSATTLGAVPQENEPSSPHNASSWPRVVWGWGRNISLWQQGSCHGTEAWFTWYYSRSAEQQGEAMGVWRKWLLALGPSGFYTVSPVTQLSSSGIQGEARAVAASCTSFSVVTLTTQQSIRERQGEGRGAEHWVYKPSLPPLPLRWTGRGTRGSRQASVFPVPSFWGVFTYALEVEGVL